MQHAVRRGSLFNTLLCCGGKRPAWRLNRRLSQRFCASINSQRKKERSVLNNRPHLCLRLTQALTTDKVIGVGFFSALERVKQIHEDCKGLLRTNQQRAGLSIMEEMATLQEAAFEHLYRWTQCTAGHAAVPFFLIAHASHMPKPRKRCSRASNCFGQSHERLARSACAV